MNPTNDQREIAGHLGAEISQCCHVSRLRLSTILVVSPIDFPHLDSVSFIASTAPAAQQHRNTMRIKKNSSRAKRGTPDQRAGC
jgi:hypothetical protein